MSGYIFQTFTFRVIPAQNSDGKNFFFWKKTNALKIQELQFVNF